MKKLVMFTLISCLSIGIGSAQESLKNEVADSVKGLFLIVNQSSVVLVKGLQKGVLRERVRIKLLS